MTLAGQIIKNIIIRVINAQDYRIEIVNLINAEFLQFTIDFFKKIVDAKMHSRSITIDWYRNAFLSQELPADEIAINAGLNKKTISNMYGSANKTIVFDASIEHFESLFDSIQSLLEIENEIDINLTIKFNGVSIDLNVSESLVVINTLAVKRAQLRGGLWSTAGKSVEKHLMVTLCKLFKVPEENYDSNHFVKDKGKKVDREVDFYLINDSNKYLCEVKLMGKGNPESADAIIARDTDVFVADTLSTQNKNQCDQLDINWIALREKGGFRKFSLVLKKLNIPYTEFEGELNLEVSRILDEIV